VTLPAADDLFRSTRHAREQREPGSAARELAGRGRSETVEPATQQAPQSVTEPIAQSVTEPIAQSVTEPTGPSGELPAGELASEKAAPRSSGRVRHDEKMTVYVTADELLDIERARLSLRRDQGLAVDRGRLVREAIAIVLADLETNGDDSVLVQRLIGR